MSDIVAVVIVPVLIAVLASSGFWAYVQKRSDNDNAQTRMLIGLGHDRIMQLASQYIERGYITHHEYENLHKYLYVPYKELGGNGSAERLIAEIDKLPIKSKK